MGRQADGGKTKTPHAPPARGPHTGLTESDTVEFKQNWTEEALYDLAAFANTRGGALYVGIDKAGHALEGVDVSDAQQQAVANKILAQLRLAPDIQVVAFGDCPTLAIRVDAVRGVTLRGVYYTRIGTVTAPLPQDQLARTLLANLNRSWDALPSSSTLADLDADRVQAFVRSAHARPTPRLPAAVRDSDPLEIVLGNLDLLAEGRPTNAAVLLFGRAPQRWIREARISIARFRTINDFDALPDATGTLFEQIDTALRAVALANPTRITFPEDAAVADDVVARTRRREAPTYPELALKEAITNAVVHRDYTRLGAEVQVRLYPDRVVVMSPGGLMPGVTLASLARTPHPSERRNPLIAAIGFIDYWVERYGTGTTRMIELCRAAGLPPPEFAVEGETFVVTFRHDRLAEGTLRDRGLNARQIAAVRHLQAHGSITTAAFMALTGAPRRTAVRDLDGLVGAALVVREGAGAATRYQLRPSGD